MLILHDYKFGHPCPLKIRLKTNRAAAVKLTSAITTYISETIGKPLTLQEKK